MISEFYQHTPLSFRSLIYMLEPRTGKGLLANRDSLCTMKGMEHEGMNCGMSLISLGHYLRFRDF